MASDGAVRYSGSEVGLWWRVMVTRDHKEMKETSMVGLRVGMRMTWPTVR